MRSSVTLALLLLVILAALPAALTAHAQGAPSVAVTSVYTLDRYGFATINESVMFTNNGSSAVAAPSLTFGFGNLSSRVSAYDLAAASGFTLSTPSSQGGPYTINGGGPIAAGGNSSFRFSVLLDNVVSTAKTGSRQVLVLTSPSVSATVDRLTNEVAMPTSTAFRSSPQGMTASLAGTTNSYSSTASEVTPAAATSVRAVASSTVADFNPLHVFSAVRTITASGNGNPLVTDTVELQNMGTNPLGVLHVDIIAPATTKVTVLPGPNPPLVSPLTLSLSNGAIPLAAFASGYPNPGVPTGSNFTISYQYPLGASYYSVSGGQVTVKAPESPPVRAFVDSYTVGVTLPQGASGASAPTTLGTPGTPVTPWQGGEASFTYSLGFGWAINAGVPAASVIFVLLLLALFVSRTTSAQVEETEEEETSTVMASDMIKAFDEKTTLINGLWPEIEGKDPNEVGKAYFDELRGRLDSFRSRALQRLNEVRQKSSSQRFSEVLNQIQTTEREVDRAAKDKLNLYQQYYLRQMRKEVYDRLLPQYTKRQERALNQLSDELHTVQRAAKLL